MITHKKRKWNQFSQLRWTSTKVILITHIQMANENSRSTVMLTLCHAKSYDRFIEIMRNLRRAKLHKMNQGSNFLRDNLPNRENIRIPTKFRIKRLFQHLKRWFFIKNRPTHFHINSTTVVRLVKWNKLSFSNIKIDKPLPEPLQYLVAQIQVQKAALVVAINQKSSYNKSSE